LGMCSRDGW